MVGDLSKDLQKTAFSLAVIPSPQSSQLVRMRMWVRVVMYKLRGIRAIRTIVDVVERRTT